MTLIEPVSSLSIRRAVNLYTIILFLSFGALLYWLATDRYEVFVDSHEHTARSTTKMVEFQLNKILREQQREINIFTEDSQDILAALLSQPGNQSIKDKLISRLKKYQPDFLEFCMLSASGRAISSSLDNINDSFCIKGFKDNISSGKHPVKLEADSEGYHYDITSNFIVDGKTHYFVVSFSTDEIISLMNSTQSERHNLLLINRDASNITGITAQGHIKNVSGGLSFEVHNGVNLSTLSKVPVKNTSWYIVDMSDADLFSNYRNKILLEFFIAYYIFAMIVLFMRHILLKQDAKRSAAEDQLKKNHDQIKVLNNSLEQLSKRDSLTGLYNRRHFDEMINHEWNRGLRSKQAIACVLLDIDHFKNYNDFYGHQAGDKCIKQISDLLKNTFRRAGDIVARYGGEEFIIAMADSSEDDAKLAIVKFQIELKKLKIPHEASSTDSYVTASAGIAISKPSKDVKVESLIRNADTALYQAKENGRNQLVVYKEKKISQGAHRI